MKQRQFRLSKRNLKLPILILFLILILIQIGDPAGFTIDNILDSNSGVPWEGPYKVIRVVDGDTLIADINGTEERIRLIGIDTPESVHPDDEKNVEYGKVAAAFSESMLEGEKVSIELDVQERDQYGRILAYIYLDGKMFNKTLLEEGHARVSTYPPNVKYVQEFTALQEKAREEKKGIWAYWT